MQNWLMEGKIVKLSENWEYPQVADIRLDVTAA